jgi:GNAT superfamily N-acetyltransferase
LKRVRLAALEDAPAAFGSTYAAEANRPEVEWVDRAVAGSEGSDRATFFALLNGEVVGLVGGCRDEPSSPIVELVSMWVAPHVRHQGVGGALVAAVTEWAVGTNALSIALWVTRGNTAAETLYYSMGFVATGEVQLLPSDSSRDEARMELDDAPRRGGEVICGEGDGRGYPQKMPVGSSSISVRSSSSLGVGSTMS